MGPAKSLKYANYQTKELELFESVEESRLLPNKTICVDLKSTDLFLAIGIEYGGSVTKGASQSILGGCQTKCSSATTSSTSTILAEPTLLGLLLNKPKVRDEMKCFRNFWSCKNKLKKCQTMRIVWSN